MDYKAYYLNQAMGNNYLTNKGQKDINHEILAQKKDEITENNKISSIKRPANKKTYVILKKRSKPDIFD